MPNVSLLPRVLIALAALGIAGQASPKAATPTPSAIDRDLFEVVPGGSDKKIGDHDVVEIRNGLRFFTAPAQINPG